MPAATLRCRACDADHGLTDAAICSKCFGPLDPYYDMDAARASFTPERIAAGPLSLWRYADLLPVSPPDEQRLAPGFTPLVPAPRLALALGIGSLHLKLDTANPTHSFKDRVVAALSLTPYHPPCGPGARDRPLFATFRPYSGL